MSTDKSTDALETLGTIIPEGCGRDAIHVAVLPCVAGSTLLPGMDIGLVDGIASRHAEKLIGIVDPFLKYPVEDGQRFWMLLYPRTITGLRHVWQHPAFDDADIVPVSKNKAASEKWLREKVDVEYDTLIESVESYIKNGYGYGNEYLTILGEDANGPIPFEFWEHIEIVMGKSIPHRAKYFSCSC